MWICGNGTRPDKLRQQGRIDFAFVGNLICAQRILAWFKCNPNMNIVQFEFLAAMMNELSFFFPFFIFAKKKHQ